MEPITVWTKPVCQQCSMVKKRITESITGKTGLSPAQVGTAWELLKMQGAVAEADLTAEERAKDLEYFKGLGYGSAPLTEFNNSIVPGFNVAELDKLIEAWKLQEPA